jgi:hypothetical protein
MIMLKISDKRVRKTSFFHSHITVILHCQKLFLTITDLAYQPPLVFYSAEGKTRQVSHIYTNLTTNHGRPQNMECNMKLYTGNSGQQ